MKQNLGNLLGESMKDTHRLGYVTYKKVTKSGNLVVVTFATKESAQRIADSLPAWTNPKVKSLGTGFIVRKLTPMVKDKK